MKTKIKTREERIAIAIGYAIPVAMLLGIIVFVISTFGWGAKALTF